MADIVERIAKAIVASQPSYSRLDMDGAYPMAQQAHTVMADEIERLRASLRAFNIMLSNPDYDFAELLEEYSAIVRSALEEKSDETT